MRADGGDQTRLTFNETADGLPSGRRTVDSWRSPATAPAPRTLHDARRRQDQVNRTSSPAFDIAPDWQPLDDD